MHGGEGTLDITDAVSLFGYLFLGSAEPGCLEAADANDDARLDISDGVYLLNFLFGGGSPPPAPGPPGLDCGPGPASSETFLGCEVYDGC
ncbi:MAG: hypothetical protein O7J95_10825 [Planctomycetota bacterium]|nr:hypothetical protein [Planctomycetota bacterium]